MDLNETAVFVKVVQTGSFSEAARQLGLPTSTISTRVSRLEKRLGVTLLQRTTRRLHLTDVGEVYFQHAALGMSHLSDAEVAITEALGEPKGVLRVTAPADLGDRILADILKSMREAYPNISIDLALMDRYVDLVAEGIDVAIRAGELKDSTLVAKNVGTASWSLYASPAYLKSASALNHPSELKQHDCLQFTPLGREAWKLNKQQQQLIVPMTGQIMINDIRVIHAMAIDGEGVALLPNYHCQQECLRAKLVKVLPEWHAKLDPIHIVYPRQRFVHPKLRAFIDVAALKLNQVLD